MDVQTENSVKTNLQQIQQNIKKACEKSGRNQNEITIIGITKYVTLARTKEAIEAGVVHLGENRDNEFLAKYNELSDEVNWHFVGTLQSRKVRDVVNKVTAIHSVDRMSVIKQIERRAHERVDCFVQVNVSEEQAKHGLAPEDVLPFIASISEYENVRIVGLMTIAPHTNDENTLRSVFRTLASLRNEINEKQYEYAPCYYLSMGMSNDYEIAIEEGATHIRIGSNLVGSPKS